jgi:hypothetical protein
MPFASVIAKSCANVLRDVDDCDKLRGHTVENPNSVVRSAPLGMATEEESVEMGKRAAAFTRSVLSRPFKVTTKGQDAMGASQLKREYAFVETADGEDLAELLISRGLARSYGEDAEPPGKCKSALRAKSMTARNPKPAASVSVFGAMAPPCGQWSCPTTNPMSRRPTLAR